MKKKLAILLLALLLAAGVYIVRNQKPVKDILRITGNKETKTVIALDAGHGGFDPGKVGVNNALEKDINLAIALELKALLEKNGYEILMTRDADTGLYSEGDSNKKRADMNNRVLTINESAAALAVSIHQNSFSQASSHGAQVFYHQLSEEGKKLAEVLQKKIKEEIKDGNNREAKANDSYYMLKKTECPLVIVECGFLSNPEEAEKLVTEEYQKQMAEAICFGIMQYLEQEPADEGE